MREKELRLAVVLTGGVSLAVFMHGVSRELAKLTRASKVLHSHDTSPTGPATSYASLNDDPKRESDTEEVYFELLQALLPEIDLRVVIDVIAGSSAGGVNGVMLARALAHDLPLDAHRAMWLKHADAMELMDRKAAATRWSKIYLEPLTRLLFSTWWKPIGADLETRTKLALFLRSRWFKPPFSGERFSGWMLDACEKMENGRGDAHSLMPDGHALDLFVSLTDFHGHDRAVRLYDPGRIIETEHQHHLHFSYLRGVDGAARSEFGRDNVPGLVFAARATASFPGAFRPATIEEMDKVLAARGQVWPARRRFIEGKFRAIARSGRDVEQAAFIDGSTVNDKPFAAVIGALSGRPAHRQVSRRLVFVDPDPATGKKRVEGVPGMFRTMLAAMVEIPANEPVREELERLEKINARIRIARRVIDLARPQVAQQVEKIIGPRTTRRPTMRKVARWRESANERAVRNSGFAFESYFRLKILNVVGHVQRLLNELAGGGVRNVDEDKIETRLNAWAQGALDAIRHDGNGVRTRDIEFLRRFDVDFRVRRLRFVIRRLNELYHSGAGGIGDAARKSEDLDRVKVLLYAHLENIRRRWDGAFYGPELAAAVAALEREESATSAIGEVMDQLGQQMDVARLDEEVDEIFATAAVEFLDREARHELITAYVGFSFFDVLSYPMLQGEDLGELDEILIHRISPADARALQAADGEVTLKGLSLRHFGAFFNRRYREHDYLWGRLTAADRLVDVVLDAACGAAIPKEIDAGAIKARLFARILKAEAPFLNADSTLLDKVRAKVLGGGAA